MIIIAEAPPTAPLTIVAATPATQAFVVIAGEPGAGLQANLALPGSSRMLGESYVVRASGIVTISGTQTLGTTTAVPLTAAICAGASAGFAAVLANAVASCTCAAFTQAAATGTFSAPFEVEFQSVGASEVSGVGQGFFADINGRMTVTSRAASTNPVTGVNQQSEPPVQFAVTLSNAGSSNISGTITAQLTAFVLES